MKLNSDGPSKTNKVVGCACGGVVRDHRGDWKIGFFKYLRLCSAAILAEFWSLFEGLKMTKFLGMMRVEFPRL